MCVCVCVCISVCVFVCVCVRVCVCVCKNNRRVRAMNLQVTQTLQLLGRGHTRKNYKLCLMCEAN